MNLDLERADILNLLAALNSIQVQGKASMVAVLRLMQKLEGAVKPAGEDRTQKVPDGGDKDVE